MHLAPKKVLKVVDVKGLYVTPGLIDIHVHAYAGTGEKGAYGTKRLTCGLTIKDGKVVYDYDGITADMWNATKHSSNPRLAGHWTTFGERLYPAELGKKYPPSTPAGNFPPQK